LFNSLPKSLFVLRNIFCCAIFPAASDPHNALEQILLHSSHLAKVKDAGDDADVLSLFDGVKPSSHP
jgi:hypothetical protein